MLYHSTPIPPHSPALKNLLFFYFCSKSYGEKVYDFPFRVRLKLPTKAAR